VVGHARVTVVIGAGCAGLAAATRLVEAGCRVVLVEQSRRLGGRTSTFTDRETGERVDNGQHVLFGCYRETYGFLRRIGAGDLAPLQRRLTLAMAGKDGRVSTLTCPPWKAPWHLVGGVLGWSALGLLDRASVLRLWQVFTSVERRGAAETAAAVPEHQTVSDWLRLHGQSEGIRQWLWDPLVFAALNQAPDQAAAGPFVRVLGELFGRDPEASAVGLPVVPLEDLIATPAVRYLTTSRLEDGGPGGEVVAGTAATLMLDEAGSVAGVRVGDRTIPARTVISAVPWYAFPKLWGDDPPESLRPLAQAASAMPAAPIVTVNIWLDGPILRQPFLGLVGGPMHWVFDKGALYGHGNGSAHLSVVASGADDLAVLSNDELVRRATDQLRRMVPAMRERRLTRTLVVRERRATFSLAPGGPRRPATATPVDGFYLAGDWTDTGLPATIEGAVISGHRAAGAVIRRVRGV